MIRVAFSCFFALFLALPAFATDAQILQNGQILLRQTQEWPPFSKPTPPGPCDVITTLTISDSGNGAFLASLEDGYAGQCTASTTPVSPNPRTYHIQASGNMLCGMGYQSTEKDSDNLPAASLNDYRNAPTSCTHPTQGPAIAPVLSLQELNNHGATNWETYQ